MNLEWIGCAFIVSLCGTIVFAAMTLIFGLLYMAAFK